MQVSSAASKNKQILSGSQIKRNILRVGLITCLGRIVGLAKDALLAAFLGVGAQADAFLLAFRIPNMLRTTFAEGSIPGALVPVSSKLLKNGEQNRVRGLLTLVMLCLAGIGLFLWGVVLMWPEKVVGLVASGLEPARLAMTANFLKIMFPFLIIVSLCAATGSVLHSANHFTIQAAGPPIFNLVWMSTIFLAITFSRSVEFVCLSVLIAGLCKLLVRWSFLKIRDLLPAAPTKQSFEDLFVVASKFAPLGLGIVFSMAKIMAETQLGSFLPVGQITLMHLAFRVFNLPLYAIATPISSTILPQVSKVSVANPKRVRFYLFESFKFVCWATIPVSILIILNSESIISVVASGRATPEQVKLGASFLSILAAGLFFEVFNKVLRNFFYAKGDTKIPTMVWGFSVAMTTFLSFIAVFAFDLGGRGILAATILSWVIETPLKLGFFAFRHGVNLPLTKSVKFLNLCFIKVFLSVLVWFVAEQLFRRFGSQGLLANHKVLVRVFPALMALAFFYFIILISKDFKTFKNSKSYFFD